jgi:hypothetical protein
MNRVIRNDKKTKSDGPRAGDSIWERILAIAAAIPDEELEKLPKDGAANHDQYLYAKRQTR